MASQHPCLALVSTLHISLRPTSGQLRVPASHPWWKLTREISLSLSIGFEFAVTQFLGQPGHIHSYWTQDNDPTGVICLGSLVGEEVLRVQQKSCDISCFCYPNCSHTPQPAPSPPSITQCDHSVIDPPTIDMISSLMYYTIFSSWKTNLNACQGWYINGAP